AEARAVVAPARDLRRAEQPPGSDRRPGRRVGDLFDRANGVARIARPLGDARELEERPALRRNGGERERGVLEREIALAALIEEARAAVVRRAATEAPAGECAERVVHARQIAHAARGQRAAL